MVNNINPKKIRIFVENNRFHLVDNGRPRRRHDQEEQRDQICRQVHHHVHVAERGGNGYGLNPIFLVFLEPVELDANAGDEMSQEAEEQQVVDRAVDFDRLSRILGRIVAETKKEILRIFSFADSIDGLSGQTDPGGPDVEEESPKIILQCGRVFQVEEKHVSDYDDGV